MTELLVVEDDRVIGRALERSLREQGYLVRWECTGQGALAASAAGDFDLVLLDIGLPDVDGAQVCRRIRRAKPGCVIVMLTARQDEMDVVVGLEAGADDYLTKPFRMAELLARVRAHLRRGSGVVSPAALRVGKLVVDRDARRVDLAGRDVVLRAKEFDLLVRLAADAGVALSRETLMADVWDAHWFGSTKTLDVHVAAVRAKLAAAAGDRAVAVPTITTLRGHGYRLEKSA